MNMLLTTETKRGIIEPVEVAGRFSLSTYISPSERPATSTLDGTNWWADLFGVGMNIKCSKCGELKLDTEFYADNRSSTGKQSQCKACMLQHFRDLYKSGERKRYMQEYYSRPDVIERRREYMKEYLHSYNQLERVKEKKRERNRTPHSIEVRKKYYLTENYLEGRKRYKSSAKYRAKVAREHHMRKVREENTVCDLTAEQWEEIKLAQDYKCSMCGEVKPLHRDHIIPVSKGGGLTKSNVQGLCISCNSIKGDRIL